MAKTNTIKSNTTAIEAAQKLLAEQAEKEQAEVGEAINNLLIEKGYELITMPFIQLNGQPAQIGIKKIIKQ